MQSLDAELLRLEGLEDPLTLRAPVRPKLPAALPEALPEDLPGQVMEEKDKDEVPLGVWFGIIWDQDQIKQGPKEEKVSKPPVNNVNNTNHHNWGS